MGSYSRPLFYSFFPFLCGQWEGCLVAQVGLELLIFSYACEWCWGWNPWPSLSGNSISHTISPAQTLMSLSLFFSSLAKPFLRFFCSFKVHWLLGRVVTLVSYAVKCPVHPVLCGARCLVNLSWVCFLAIGYF